MHGAAINGCRVFLILLEGLGVWPFWICTYLAGSVHVYNVYNCSSKTRDIYNYMGCHRIQSQKKLALIWDATSYYF